ncbi:hypothetical protein PS15p_201234 [Mucor circinelloides]
MQQLRIYFDQVMCEKEEQAEQLQHLSKQFQAMQEQFSNEITGIKAQLYNAERENEHLRGEVKNLQNSVRELQYEKLQLEQENGSQRAQIQDLQEDYASSLQKAKHDYSNMCQQKELIDKEYLDLSREFEKLQHTHQKLRTKADYTQDSMATLQERIDELEQQALDYEEQQQPQGSQQIQADLMSKDSAPEITTEGRSRQTSIHSGSGIQEMETIAVEFRASIDINLRKKKNKKTECQLDRGISLLSN